MDFSKKERFIFTLLITIFTFYQSFCQWQKMDSKTDASFRSIHTLSKKIVWAGGTKGTILKTIDGGKNWQILKVEGAENLDFRDIFAVNSMVAYIMSAGDADKGAAKIFKTIDGGKTWKTILDKTEKGIFFDSMDFWNENEGIVLSDPIDDKPLIFRTLDGGKTWNRIEKDKIPAINTGEASFAASGTCVVVKGKNKAWFNTQNRVFFTKNKGETWEVVNTAFKKGETSGIFGLHFYTETNGIAVGGDYKNDKQVADNVAVTHDGGRNWELLPAAKPDGLKEASWFVNQKSIVLVGTSGTSLSVDFGKTWQNIDNESFHTISCFKNTCFAIGGKGNLGKWEF